MQDHEDFILFRQKINLMMKSLGEKIKDLSNRVAKLENKVEGSDHVLLEFQNDLKLIDIVVKNIDSSLKELNKSIDEREEKIKIINDDEISSLNNKVQEVLEEPTKKYKSRKEVVINTIITVTISALVTAILANII
jgi:predicted  nucleic acid-binding Zn-ribbon protein